MICKEDVVNWFRDLKSYNRIDTMCVLLNMCLPFELRFLGTYLEELGRRDGPELRGAELKVNNPQEFIADIASGEPTDRRIRRKMALFLALFRTCNHTYANELFKTLEGWGARGDLQRLFEEDVLQELLLVYTMATNHPVFSFEQRLHCGEIFTKLKSCETKSGSQQQRLQDRDDTGEHQQHPQHQQQHHTTQHHQHHHQHQSQHQSLDSLQSNSPQQSPIQQQQQQQHHQQQSQHQPPHLQNSTPPPVSSQLTPQMASGPDTTALHQALPPNAPMSLQLVPQSGVPTTIALSYPGQPALTQVVGTGMDGSITTHYIEALPQLAQLPLQPDFTIPPPGPNTTTRWAATFPVYHPMYPPPASSPHMSNPSSPIQSRTTSPTRIHPSSVQHRISRNQQNDQQQQQQNQAQVQNLKNVDEDQTTLMMSQMQLRNGMRQPHNTLPRQSKQGYVNQLPSYHHQQQQQQQQQHHSQRGDSSGSGSYHTLNYTIKGAGMMMDMMNHHQSKSTGSDSGSSIGSDVSPPETPGVVSVSGGGSGGGGGGGVPHVRSSNRSNMRTINGRLEKPTYSQLQQQQQFAGSDTGGLMVVTSGGQNFLTTGTTNGAAMSSNGNNGASGSGVVSGPLLINPAAAAGTVPPNPGNSTGTTGTSLLLSTPAYATGPYAGSATAYQVGTGAPHLVPHRQIAGATLTHAGTQYRPAAYPPSMQPSTADGLMYPYHTTTVLPPPSAAAAGTPGSVGQASSLPFLPPPTGPGGTTVGSAVAVASTQTSLPNLRSSPSQQQSSATAGIGSSSIGLLQTGKPMTISGYVTGLPLVSSTFGVGGGSCYNCGSQKHTGLDCPEASMEDMTRNSNFTLDYNTTSSSSGPSSVTLTTTSTSTLAAASNNNSSAAEHHHSAGVIKLDRDNSSSSSSTGSSSNNSTSSSGVGTGSTQMTSNSTASSNSSSSSNNNNNNGSNSSNNSNNSSLDVPSSSPTSSSMAAAVALESGNSGVPGATGGSSSNSSNAASSSSSSGSTSGSSNSSSNNSNLVNVSGK
uniref:Putative heat shock factor hsf-type dna-binding domain-containing protein n=1 Tax=Anopheles braziliensis TaxID=58242 RepID=A0A2M3ZFW5_9DIPT